LEIPPENIVHVWNSELGQPASDARLFSYGKKWIPYELGFVSTGQESGNTPIVVPPTSLAGTQRYRVWLYGLLMPHSVQVYDNTFHPYYI